MTRLTITVDAEGAIPFPLNAYIRLKALSHEFGGQLTRATMEEVGCLNPPIDLIQLAKDAMGGSSAQ